MTYSLNYKVVCRAAPGKASGSANYFHTQKSCSEKIQPKKKQVHLPKLKTNCMIIGFMVVDFSISGDSAAHCFCRVCAFVAKMLHSNWTQLSKEQKQFYIWIQHLGHSKNLTGRLVLLEFQWLRRNHRTGNIQQWQNMTGSSQLASFHSLVTG